MSTDGQWHEARHAIDLVSGKWVIKLLEVLEPGSLRHNDLLRAASPIGSTALGNTLRRMEGAGLVERQVDATETPPTVSYALTGDARGLLTALEPLARWMHSHAGQP